MQLFKRMTDNRRSEMPDVKGLSHIRRGIVEDYRLAVPDIRSTVGDLARSEYALDKVVSQIAV